LKKIDILVIGGGELLRDDFGIKPILGFLDKVLLAKHYKKTVVLFGVGVGPIRTSLGRMIIRNIAKNCEIIITRDKESAEKLIDIGIKVPIISSHDVVFSRYFWKNNRICDLSASTNPRIAVSIRDWPKAYNSNMISKKHQVEKFLEFRDAMKKLLKFIDDEYNASFHGISLQQSFGDDDYHAILGIFNESGIRNYDMTIYDNNIESVITKISECDLMIGMRLHACIIALSNGIPTLAVNYDSKLDKLMYSVGMQKYILDIMNPSFLKYKEQFLKINNINRIHIIEKIEGIRSNVHLTYENCLLNIL